MWMSKNENSINLNARNIDFQAHGVPRFFLVIGSFQLEITWTDSDKNFLL